MFLKTTIISYSSVSLQQNWEGSTGFPHTPPPRPPHLQSSPTTSRTTKIQPHPHSHASSSLVVSAVRGRAATCWGAPFWAWVSETYHYSTNTSIKNPCFMRILSIYLLKWKRHTHTKKALKRKVKSVHPAPHLLSFSTKVTTVKFYGPRGCFVNIPVILNIKYAEEIHGVGSYYSCSLVICLEKTPRYLAHSSYWLYEQRYLTYGCIIVYT